MFGIELDKLLLVGVLVGLIVGPARLKEWRRTVPRIVGRVHARYQQGRADVTRNLDDLAPDWREYDPRQFHPRRILREVGDDLRRAAEGVDPRAGSEVSPGEAAVESSTEGDHARRGRTAPAAGDRRPGVAHASEEEHPLGDLERRGADPDGRSSLDGSVEHAHRASDRGFDDVGRVSRTPPPGEGQASR